MEKKGLLYSGKAKSVYSTDNDDQVIIHFKNDTSAFDGKKLVKLEDKGYVNNHINAFLMEYLASQGINTHHIKLLNERDELVKRLHMIPVECVVRNVVAGSLAKRFDLTEGTELSEPVFEFYFKDDALGDPLINSSHIRVFTWACNEEIVAMEQLSLRINKLLKSLFANAKMSLVDFKLEFGRYHGELYLGDEITPDCCRIWDVGTNEKMDKDRFRRDLGNVVDFYKETASRLGVSL